MHQNMTAAVVSDSLRQTFKLNESVKAVHVSHRSQGIFLRSSTISSRHLAFLELFTLSNPFNQLLAALVLFSVKITQSKPTKAKLTYLCASQLLLLSSSTV